MFSLAGLGLAMARTVKIGLLIYTSILIPFIHAMIPQCPSMCRCGVSPLWGGTLLNCSHSSLQAVPNITTVKDVTEFYLDHNNISVILDSDFQTQRHLRKLVLHHNSIRLIEEDTFVHENLMHMESLDLSHNHLRSIPSQLPIGLNRLMLSYNDIDGFNFVPFINLQFLEILYLDHNKISSIRRKSFYSPHHVEGKDASLLKRLKKLALNGNSISTVEDFSFKSLYSLQRLTLANNLVQEVTKGTLTGLTNLEYLDLRSNEISFIQADALGKLKMLKYLYLKNNQLTVLPKSLPLLEWFDISSNFITKIDEKDYKDDIYPLDILVIADNPLHCDCHMLWLKELFDRREHLYHFVAGKNSDMIPICKSPPEVAGETWDLLGDDMFECSDDKDPPQSEIDLAKLTSQAILQEMSTATGADNKIYKHFMLTNITHTSALLTWRSRQYLKSHSVKIQHYIFGRRETFQSVIVPTNDQAYILQNLDAGLSYIVCLIPVETSDISLDQCTEFSTPMNNLIDWKRVMEYLSYSFVLMVKLTVAMIMACVIVGTGAIIASAWSCSQEMSAHKDSADEELSESSSDESVHVDYEIRPDCRPRKKVKSS